MKKGLIILVALVVAVCIPVLLFSNPSNKKIVEKQSKVLDQMAFVDSYSINSDATGVEIKVKDVWFDRTESEQIMLAQALQNKLTDLHTGYSNKVSIVFKDNVGKKLMKINMYGNVE